MLCRYNHKMMVIREFMAKKRVTDQLRERVITYYSHLYATPLIPLPLRPASWLLTNSELSPCPYNASS